MVTLPVTLGDLNPPSNHPNFYILRCLSYLHSGRNISTNRCWEAILVDRRCTNHKVETTDYISMKFCVDIIFRTGSCLIINRICQMAPTTEERASHVGTRANISSLVLTSKFYTSRIIVLNSSMLFVLCIFGSR